MLGLIKSKTADLLGGAPARRRTLVGFGGGSPGGRKPGAGLVPTRNGHRGQKRLITGLDIGTTKVCAIIAEADEDGVNILGLGSSPSRGMRRGVVTDLDDTVAAIDKAFRQAHELARRVPSELYVGIAGDHISGIEAQGAVNVANPNVGIDRRDCDAAIRRALRIAIPEDQEIVHHIVREYIVDGNPGIHRPVGLFGARLEVQALVVTGGVAASNNLCRCVRRAGLKTSGIVLESLASSLAVLSERELEMGVVVIDIGGGTTDLAIFADGTLQHTTEIAHGGDIITHDVATVLRCTPYKAENMKKRFGHANPLCVDADEHIDLPSPVEEGKRVTYSRRELAEIVEARAEEILIAVRKAVQRSGLRDRVYGGVVLTGGTALLEGLTDVAERILEMPARVGAPRGLKGLSHIVNSPIYSTGVGLIRWAAEEGPGYLPVPRWLKWIKEVFDFNV